LVFLWCEPNDRNLEHSNRDPGRASFHRGAALHEPLGRSEPGLFRRWQPPQQLRIARNTAFTFKGNNSDAKEIGRQLGARYVLEGSVQREKNRYASMRNLLMPRPARISSVL
jgi:hypothetical protein